MKESKDIRIIIPAESYQIINFKQEELPGIAVINTALKNEALKEVFSWNCSIMIDFDETAENGIPTKEELKIIESFEDYLDGNIKGKNNEKPNALFFGKVTWNSTRQLIWKVYNPKQTNDFLQGIINTDNCPRAFDYRIEEDENWNLTSWYTRNLEK